MSTETANHHDQNSRAESESTIGSNGAAEVHAREEATRRAEEMIDRMGERIGHYAAQLGHHLLRFTARAREEVEDIWAEAQNIRRGGRP
jgi:hypothetical protein